MIDISEKIKELRIEKNLKQKDVAKALNIATNTLSQFENNKGRPSLEVLTGIADFFEVSIDYLVGREDDFGNVVVAGQTSDQLTQKEKRLLQAFSSLPELEQNKLISDAEFYALRHVKQGQH